MNDRLTLIKDYRPAQRQRNPRKPSAVVGLSGDALEAQTFAVLAVRSLPLSYPGTTGVPRPPTGGVLARP